MVFEVGPQKNKVRGEHFCEGQITEVCAQYPPWHFWFLSCNSNQMFLAEIDNHWMPTRHRGFAADNYALMNELHLGLGSNNGLPGALPSHRAGADGPQPLQYCSGRDPHMVPALPRSHQQFLQQYLCKDAGWSKRGLISLDGSATCGGCKPHDSWFVPSPNGQMCPLMAAGAGQSCLTLM